MGVKGIGSRSGCTPAKEYLVDIWSSFKANPQTAELFSSWFRCGVSLSPVDIALLSQRSFRELFG